MMVVNARRMAITLFRCVDGARYTFSNSCHQQSNSISERRAVSRQVGEKTKKRKTGL